MDGGVDDQPGAVAGVGPVDLGLLVLGKWVDADSGNAPPAVEHRIYRCEVEGLRSVANGLLELGPELGALIGG